MRKLTVEWKYYGKDNKTCKRCSGTRKNIYSAIVDLQKELRVKNVDLELKETILTENKIPESNMILIDGVPLEEILPGASKGESECCSCQDLCGKPTDCRTVKQDGRIFEEIPTYLIKEAVLKVFYKNRF